MKKGTKKMLDGVAMTLTAVGGLNWGLEAFNYNLVEALLGGFPMVVRVVYGAVGLSALWLIGKQFKVI